VIENEYKQLEKFGKALRREDREIFQEMMYKARLHTQAGSYSSLLEPMQGIVIGMLIEQEKMLRKILGSIEQEKELRRLNASNLR